MAPRGKAASKRKEPVEEAAEAPAAQPDAQQQERAVRRRVAAAQKEALQAIEHGSHPKVLMCGHRRSWGPPPAPSSPGAQCPIAGASLQARQPRRRSHPLPPLTRRRSLRPLPRSQVAGDVFVFGDGDCGQLGQGEEVTERLRPSPLSVAGKKVRWRVQQRAAGTRAPLVDRRRLLPAPAFDRRSKHPPARQVLQISCGGMHTVALTEGGEVYSWGVNDEGALGRHTAGELWEKSGKASGKPGDAYTPGCVHLPKEAGRIVQLSAGEQAFRGALLASVGLLAGRGRTSKPVSLPLPCRRRQPLPPPALPRAGDSHTCALSELGAVWAWGTYRDASGVMGFSKHTRIQVGWFRVHPGSPLAYPA